jgi:hypothetical protein
MGSGNKFDTINTPMDSPQKRPRVNVNSQKQILNKKAQNYNKNKQKTGSSRYDRVRLDNFDEFEDEDIHEESFMNKDAEKKRIKIEKFEIASRPKAYRNIVRVCFVVLVFIAISFADYLVNKNSQEDLKWLLDNQKSLIDL